jgi:hypothetical protein
VKLLSRLRPTQGCDARRRRRRRRYFSKLCSPYKISKLH